MQFLNLRTHNFEATQISPKFFKVHLTISPLLLCVCGGEEVKTGCSQKISLLFNLWLILSLSVCVCMCVCVCVCRQNLKFTSVLIFKVHLKHAVF